MTTLEQPPTPAPPRKRLASKVAWSTVASTVATTGGSIAGIFAARALGAAGMGQLAFLIWSMETVALVLQLGLGQTMTRFLAETGSAGLASWVARRLLVMTTLSAIVFYFATPVLGSNAIEPGTLAIAALLLFLSGPDTVARAYLGGTQNFRAVARLNIVAGCAEVAGVALGGWFFGLPGVLAGYALRPAVGLPVAWRLLRKNAPVAPDPAQRARLRRFGRWVWISSLIAIVSWSKIELLFLERIATPAQVGFFAIAIRATNLATRFPLMIGGAFMPHFAERFGADDGRSIASGYAAGTRLLALLLFPCSLGLAATAPIVVPMLYGGDFEGAVPIAAILAAGSCLAFANIGASLIAGADRLHIRVRWSIPAALLMVVLLPWAIPGHGAAGAAWVRVAVRTAVILVSSVYIARGLRIPVPVAPLLRTFCAAVVCGIGAALVVQTWTRPLALLLAVPAGGALYLVALRWLRALHPEDRAAFERFFTRLPRLMRGPLLTGLRFVGGRA